MLLVRPRRDVLTESHHVDVVVDQHGHRELPRQVRRDVELVPPGHDRRIGRTAGGVLHRPGHPDADAHHVSGLHADLAEQLVRHVRHAVEHDGRPVRDVGLDGRLLEDLAGDVDDGDGGVRRPEIDGEHGVPTLVEGEPGGRTSTGRRRLADRGEQARREQGVDAHGDGGAGQRAQLGELGLGAWLAVAQELEQGTGTLGGGCRRRDPGCAGP
jgi:hypothetical protein